MTTLVDASELLSGAEAIDQSPVQIAARSLERLIREVRGEQESVEFISVFENVQESPEALFDLFLSKATVIFEKLHSASDETTLRSFERTAEGFFTVVVSLLESFETYEGACKAIDRFIDQIAIDASESKTARVRIRSLMLLFNLFTPGTALRSEILGKIDVFAAQSPLVKAILRAHSGDRPSVTEGEYPAEISDLLKVKGEVSLPEDVTQEDELVRGVSCGAIDGMIDLVDRKIRRVDRSSLFGQVKTIAHIDKVTLDRLLEKF